MQWGGKHHPSLDDAVHAANVILALAPETNGESAYRAYAAQERRVGLPLTDLAEQNRGVTMSFAAYYVTCLALNWYYYARKGAEIAC